MSELSAYWNQKRREDRLCNQKRDGGPILKLNELKENVDAYLQLPDIIMFQIAFYVLIQWTYL
jgi:hypothetical protein